MNEFSQSNLIAGQYKSTSKKIDMIMIGTPINPSDIDLEWN